MVLRNSQKVTTWVCLALMAGMVLVAGAFRLFGGRWFDVLTPSMGQALPVGALVVTLPAGPQDLRVGDVIAFSRSAQPNAIPVTHRIVDILPDGVRTKGDANPYPDSKMVPFDNIIGRGVASWLGIGYLTRSAYLLLIGLSLTYLIGRFLLRGDWRHALYLNGTALTITLVTVIHKPFINLLVIGSQRSTDGATATLQLTSTGILPMRIHAPGGETLDLLAGQRGALTALAPNGAVTLNAFPHLDWLGWGGVALFSLLPLIWIFIIGTPSAPVPTLEESSQGSPTPALVQDEVLPPT